MFSGHISSCKTFHLSVGASDHNCYVSLQSPPFYLLCHWSILCPTYPNSSKLSRQLSPEKSANLSVPGSPASKIELTLPFSVLFIHALF